MQVVYSEQRARLLRRTLRAVQVLGLVMVLLAVGVVVTTLTGDVTDGRDTKLLYAIVLFLQGPALVAIAHWSLRRLPRRDTDTRVWCLSTAGFTLLSSLPLLSSLLGIAVVFVGLFLLTLAFVKDAEP